MNDWQQDLLTALDGACDEHRLYASVSAAAADLGFDYWAYGYRQALPVSRPRVAMFNNYPLAWQRRYEDAGYLEIDPTVAIGRRSETPMLWSGALFSSARGLWDEAQAHGLRVGWAQSSLGAPGIGGLLTLARSHDALSTAELQAQEPRMRWLAHTAHACFARILTPRLAAQPEVPLTDREIEVLRWTADGKTSADISDLLAISLNTVNFHLKNAAMKLMASNKTAAVVRAALLGLLY